MNCDIITNERVVVNPVLTKNYKSKRSNAIEG